ncbi:MAG TPA: hypothetical protein VFE40_10295 [Jatrophihabitantaceae bacterium]|nr:hypothetical protein [Jatrophihabitantaceae bacterium]
MRLRESVRQRLSGPWAAALLHGAIFGLVLSMWDVHDGRRWVATLTKTGIVAAGFAAYMWLLVYRRQGRDIDRILNPLSEDQRRMATHGAVRGEVPADPRARSAAVELVRYRLELLDGLRT